MKRVMEPTRRYLYIVKAHEGGEQDEMIKDFYMRTADYGTYPGRSTLVRYRRCFDDEQDF